MNWPKSSWPELLLDETMAIKRPREEPEVADRKRWPKPGSPEWVQRYQLAIDHVEKALSAQPSQDSRVMLAWVELTAAIREDLTGNSHG